MDHSASATDHAAKSTGFIRELGMFDSVMIVIGTMIGSGIFIVPADMSRVLGSGGWLLVAWGVTGVLTIAAAISYGELASMLPEAGGMYVYLRQAFSPIWGFLYGWTLFTVIQTGTIAAVAVAFARYSGLLLPVISEQRYIVPPIHISSGYAISLSTTQLVAIAVIALLTWTNSLGIRYGKIVQNLFTVAKTGALIGLILLGIFIGRNAAAIHANFDHLWTQTNLNPITAGLTAASSFGLLIAICVAQSGSLFSADSWHDITFAAGEVKDPRRTLPRALIVGTVVVIALYLLANVAYLLTLPITAIQNAPADRVATAMVDVIAPGFGAVIMAIAIMISTFGCDNSLILAGARVYYAMARSGLFLRSAGTLNKAHVPGRSLLVQGIWASALVLPRTFDAATGQYGNLYSNLLNYVISSALIFYILTIAGVIRLRRTQPNAERPYRTLGYPFVPIIYILGAAVILWALFMYRASSTWPGLVIVLLGVPVYVALRRRGATEF
ncbi:MAG: amino acid permease [Acidobacteriaceae bacterium]|nr:amino acid permease [Acidobacteriaceae bacterium]